MTHHLSRPKDIERIPTIIVGDIHAGFDTYRALLRREEAKAGRPLPSIQVGDYGIGNGSDAEARDVRSFHLAHRRHRFIRGNHDRPEEVIRAPGYLPDGIILGRVLFLGGAESQRQPFRPRQDTEMAQDEMDEVLKRLSASAEMPDVVVSHDAPQHVADRLWRETGSSGDGVGQGLAHSSRTRLFLDKVHAVLQPSLWLFGHWHHPWAHQDGRTHFRCVGYHEAFTLELPLTQMGIAP
ncbi:metallophosphoesterase family protein [Rubellimicrobium arenae]|uniref:metallophosphoesterase family protein n=1 Tax=Rubellimicrobium arenae TaxID=2817372 RepID=UPI001B302524|nr:metallophosphoesterase [Rubellimicrobium arenae]